MVLAKSCLILSNILRYTIKIFPYMTRIFYCIIKTTDDTIIIMQAITKILLRIIMVSQVIIEIFSATIKTRLLLRRSNLMLSKSYYLLAIPDCLSKIRSEASKYLVLHYQNPTWYNEKPLCYYQSLHSIIQILQVISKIMHGIMKILPNINEKYFSGSIKTCLILSNLSWCYLNCVCLSQI